MAWFAALVFMILAWYCLSGWLFRRLRNRHPETYESLGSPTVLLNSTPKHGWVCLKFLWSAEPSRLGDPALRRMAIFLRVFFVVYSMWLLGPLGLFALAGQLSS